MKKPIYTYEIGMPVSEYWVYQVNATSVKEAVKKIRSSDPDAPQVYTLSAPLGKTVPHVFQKTKARGES